MEIFHDLDPLEDKDLLNPGRIADSFSKACGDGGPCVGSIPHMLEELDYFYGTGLPDIELVVNKAEVFEKFAEYLKSFGEDIRYNLCSETVTVKMSPAIHELNEDKLHIYDFNKRDNPEYHGDYIKLTPEMDKILSDHSMILDLKYQLNVYKSGLVNARKIMQSPNFQEDSNQMNYAIFRLVALKENMLRILNRWNIAQVVESVNLKIINPYIMASGHFPQSELEWAA